MKVSILIAVIKRERALFNLLRERLRVVQNSLADLQGKEPAPIASTGPFTVELGEDLFIVRKHPVTKRILSRKPKTQLELARILKRERGVHLATNWKEEIRRVNNLAWMEAESQGRGFFDWTTF